MKTARTAALQALCGAFFGYMISAILTAIAIPNFSDLPVPLSVADDMAKVSRFAESAVIINGQALALLGLLVLIASWCMTARGLNAHLPAFPFLKAPRPGLAWIAVLFSGAAVAAGAWAGLNWGSQDFIKVPALGETGPRLFETLAVAAVGGAAGWLIISAAGWAGELTAWRAPWSGADASWLRTAKFGACFGLIMCAGSVAVNKLFMFLFAYNVEVWHPASDIRFAPAVTNFALAIALGAPAAVAGWSLAWALSAERLDREERLVRCVPGLAAAAIPALVGLVLWINAVQSHDWRAGGLAAAANLPDKGAAPLTAVALGYNVKPHLFIKPWQTTARFSGWTFSGEIAATEANADALLRFLGGRGRTSRYRKAAIEAVLHDYAVLWAPDKAFAAVKTLEKDYDLPFIDIMLERASLVWTAPITPENRTRLETLSDPKVYRLRGKYALNLSKAWLRFGDLARARQWLETAKATGVAADDLKSYSVPAAAPLVDGTVRGRIALTGRAGRAIQIGLFSVPEGSATADAPSHSSIVLTRLAGSQWAGKDGSFRFEHLSQGRYYLCLLASSELLPPDGKGLNAANNPGVISLDRARPRFDAGTIALTVSPGR
ncbi:MAG: hypothetical protein HY077_05250 [Elusimicrobia bacterium]|nr:hypothetical protein [Elusimicrobiota bacterium]